MKANRCINSRGGHSLSNDRIIGLDLMRITLAILIYMFHSWMHFDCDYSFLTNFVSAGAVAMTGFFMLSGYSLRLVYGDRDIMDKNSLRTFYIKRALSILPLYYAIAVMYILLIKSINMADILILLPVEVLGLQSTFSSLFTVSHNSGTWFISCLILAYVFYPYLQKITQQLNTTTKVITLCILIFMDLWSSVISNRFNICSTYDNPFYRMIEFTIGLLLADMSINHDNTLLRLLRSRITLIISIVFFITGISLIKKHLFLQDYMIYNYVALPCFIIMLLSLGTLRSSNKIWNNIVSYFAKISYAFFLVQFFAWKVGKWTLIFLETDTNWLRILITFIYCFVAAVVMYELVQKPISKYVKQNLLSYNK